MTRTSVFSAQASKLMGCVVEGFTSMEESVRRLVAHVP